MVYRLATIVFSIAIFLFGVGGILLFATVASAYAATQLGFFFLELSKAFILAGIVGLAYELFVRSIARHEQQAEAEQLVSKFRSVVAEVVNSLRSDIKSWPFSLPESARLIANTTREQIIRTMFAEMAFTPAIGLAAIETALMFVSKSSEAWAETAHFVTFSPSKGGWPEATTMVSDLIEYKTSIPKTTFRIGLLRQRKSADLFDGLDALDAYWISENSFVDDGDGPKRLLDVDDVQFSQKGHLLAYKKSVRIAPDGSELQTYKIEGVYSTEQMKISYRFISVGRPIAPFLYVQLPRPTVGLRIHVRNEIDHLYVAELRPFLPRNDDVAIRHLDKWTVDLSTNQVVFEGHGAMVFLRQDSSASAKVSTAGKRRDKHSAKDHS
jgi:hypothetical protein